MNRAVTREHYASLRAVRRTLLGKCSGFPRQELLDVHSMGLINFLSSKESKLQALVRQMDIGAHDSMHSVKLLVEFMSFIVGGLTVEADKIEEEVLHTRKAVAALTHEIQRCEMELEHKQQYSGTNVTRALAQFYRTKRVISSSTASSNRNEKGCTHELARTIARDRARLQETKRNLRVLITVQRLLWGSGTVSQEDFAYMLCEFGVALTIRRFNHKLRDLMLPLRQEARDPPKCLLSLEEFIENVHIGLSAALEDLDACLVSIKKCILLQQEELGVRRINASRERPSAEVSSVFHPSRPNRRRVLMTSAKETEELSKLYCS
ncbi:hypothetical protein MOQ_006111 [Trypanosoma cruzi marinkellei]|uniref:Uncharacterized protein n=1 Tax=Trypanosoma cruzi marinkellei TaxID=85056 RepID=K2MWK8_TRYCR|nr:hypothetical protein MOQ_006111 [Trypanosoma cruzi marinkellei]